MEKDKSLVLIVDDNPTNIDLLVGTLKNHYRLGVAKNGPNALDYAKKHQPDLILLDIMMPGMSGYEVCARLKSQEDTKNIPVIFITALTEAGHKTKGFEVGGVDYVTKPFHATEVLARVKTHISINKMRKELNAQNIILEQKVKEKTEELQEMLYSTIQTIAMTVEIRDPYTAGHMQRVAQLASAIAKKMKLTSDQVRTIDIAGCLHDIGKIRIPSSILNRSGKLLDVEFKMLKIHPRVGYDILKTIPSPWPFAEVVLQHHEKLDGSGYPEGLLGKDILPEAKILTVADVAEATSSYRPYRPAPGLEVALGELQKHRGKWYDKDAVDACVELFSRDNFKFKQINVIN